MEIDGEDSNFSFLGDLDAILTCEEVADITAILSSTRMLAFDIYSKLPQELMVETKTIQQCLAFQFATATNVYEFTLPNLDKTTNDMCPFFRIVCSPGAAYLPTNYLLEHFIARITDDKGVPFGFSVRCEKAIVYGILRYGVTVDVVDVPIDFALGSWMDRVYNPWDGLGRMPLAGLEIPLQGPCSECVSAQSKCNRKMPCTRCRDGDKPCHPVFCKEVKRVATNILAKFVKGAYTPSLMARYHLHFQSEEYCKKPMLSRGDALHVDTFLFYHICGKGLDSYFYMTEENFGDLAVLPSAIQQFIENQEIYKVEWFMRSKYGVMASPTYSKEIMSTEEVGYYRDLVRVPPKLIDSCGMFDDTCFMWWIESLLKPGEVHEVKKWVAGEWFDYGKAVPTHCCYFRRENKVVKVNIRMLTIMVGADKFITATKLIRSDVRVMM